MTGSRGGRDPGRSLAGVWVVRAGRGRPPCRRDSFETVTPPQRKAVHPRLVHLPEAHTLGPERIQRTSCSA